MHNKNQAPALADLYQLKRQIAADQTLSLAELRTRDRAIGEACAATGDAERLQFWLERTRPAADAHEPWLQQEAAVAVAIGCGAFVAGSLAMAGYLPRADGEVVQVFVLFFLFVLLQLMLSLVSAAVMVRTCCSAPPVILPINPMRFVIARMLPDKRFYRECFSVLRLLALRYGQTAGLYFTLGALLAMLVIPVGVKFSWVWGSEYGFVRDHMKQVTDAIAVPWANWLPAAVMTEHNLELSCIGCVEAGPGPELAGVDPDNTTRHSVRADPERAQGWNLFLAMSLLVYALLPRLCLYALTRYAYTAQVRRDFVHYPGSEAILRRMRTPVVQTQGEHPLDAASLPLPAGATDPQLAWLDWGGALQSLRGERVAALDQLLVQHALPAGGGSLQADLLCAQRLNAGAYARLKVLVKGWEPPLGDLRDFLGELQHIRHCTLCLLPLPRAPLTAQNIEDWTAFSRSLDIDVVEVNVMDRL